MVNKTKPRIAVITPYYKESLETLEQCHKSVRAQSEEALHVIVADGHAQQTINQWFAHHIQLPMSHNDIGSTPRLIGSYHAIGLGVETITFLDADNWYAPNHLSTAFEAMQKMEADVVTTGRMLCRLDGSEMGPCPQIDPDNFIDTNCMMLGKNAFSQLHHWVLMPKYGHLIGDRIMLHHLKNAALRRIHLDQPSVYYRCSKEGNYKLMGVPIPEGVQKRPNYEKSFRSWEEDGFPPLI